MGTRNIGQNQAAKSYFLPGIYIIAKASNAKYPRRIHSIFLFVIIVIKETKRQPG